jgi:hypothetical protein
MFAGALALLVGGCASSTETERRAQAHDQRARAAASYEDYDTAAQEKHEADRLHSKAAAQRAEEAGTPIANPPPPPPPDYVPPPPTPAP